jgi:hypothetical protein
VPSQVGGTVPGAGGRVGRSLADGLVAGLGDGVGDGLGEEADADAVGLVAPGPGEPADGVPPHAARHPASAAITANLRTRRL